MLLCKRPSGSPLILHAVVTAIALAASASLVWAADTETSRTGNTDSRPATPLPVDDALYGTLLDTLAKQPDDYQPRTEHFIANNTPRYINRLMLEQSPYLLQHAHNPVNWYPWGEEAFAEARRTGKPVFLSIGYATCHWCHVMERESFEDEAIASLMNEHFIAVKVDREQRPDVDSTFMTAVQMLTGSGGWPLSAWLTPDAEPFYGGTYFPPEHFTTLLQRVAGAWGQNKDAIVAEAAKVARALQSANRIQGEAQDVGALETSQAVFQMLSEHDDLEGGFGNAPKFPREPTLFLLMAEAARNNNANALQAADFTLQRIAAGGIHDHVGGGFHRYSVDSAWLVPHFEKMLYNQALLSRNFIEAFSLTGHQEHARTARRTLDYVLREMQSPNGGFYSATDADSEGHEGRFFVWSAEELDQRLGTNAGFARKAFNVTEQGNFEGFNILHLEDSIATLAAELDLTLAETTTRLDQISQVMLSSRQAREKPLLDDKLITGWNGLMITALAEAAMHLNEPRYREGAVAAANAIWSLNRRDDKRFHRAWFRGAASVDATQVDYAFLAEGYLALHDATGDGVWLKRAIELVDVMDEDFLDGSSGNYFMGSATAGGAQLPARPKDLFDNALPSGNAVALRVLSSLWYRTGEASYKTQGEALLASFSSMIAEYPTNFAYLLKGAGELLYGETGDLRYAARGRVRLQAKEADNGRLLVNIDIDEGWHINAQKPLQDYLIGTRVDDANGEPLDGVNYPKAKRQVLGFARAELALYEGQLILDIPQPKPANDQPLISVQVQLQACNDKVCLAPETIPLTVSLATELMTAGAR